MIEAQITIADFKRYLYDSNRSGIAGAATAGPGHDSVTVLKLGRRNGILAMNKALSAQGQRPGFMGTDAGNHSLYAANEPTDTISAFVLSAQVSVIREGRHHRPHGLVRLRRRPSSAARLRRTIAVTPTTSHLLSIRPASTPPARPRPPAPARSAAAGRSGAGWDW